MAGDRYSLFAKVAVALGTAVILVASSSGLAQASNTGDSQENVCIRYHGLENYDTRSEACVFIMPSVTVMKIAAAAYDRVEDGRSAVNDTRILQFDAGNNLVKETRLDEVVSSQGAGWSNLSQIYSVVKEQSAVRWEVGVQPCSLDVDGNQSGGAPNTRYCNEQRENEVAQGRW